MTQDVSEGKYVKPKKLMEPLACQLQLLSLVMEVCYYTIAHRPTNTVMFIAGIASVLC